MLLASTVYIITNNIGLSHAMTAINVNNLVTIYSTLFIRKSKVIHLKLNVRLRLSLLQVFAQITDNCKDI